VLPPEAFQIIGGIRKGQATVHQAGGKVGSQRDPGSHIAALLTLGARTIEEWDEMGRIDWEVVRGEKLQRGVQRQSPPPE
jgi:hypothetical protein